MNRMNKRIRKKSMTAQNEERIWNLVDAKNDEFIALSDRVFGTPETLYNEF